MSNVNKPCPNCGSNNLSFQNIVTAGHGDCTYEAWIQCDDCEIRGAITKGWGRPEGVEILKTWVKWNNIIKTKI